MGFEWVAPQNYKRHYVCLDCQKGFKRASEEDMKNPLPNSMADLEGYYALSNPPALLAYIQKAHRESLMTCPQCQKGMLQVSYVFKVPRQRDDKAWKALREYMDHKMYPDYEHYVRWHRLKLLELDNTGENIALKRQLRANLKLLQGLL